MRDAVDDLVRSHLNWRADRDFLLGCDESQLGRLMFRALDPGHPALLVSDWSGFGLHDVTFEGRPPALCTLSLPAEIADLLRSYGLSSSSYARRSSPNA